ncbi:MAG TPA: hypothetical protein VNZ58_07880 [Thermomicrobiales bacterium]|nr:hypothetical protein [Thermomicrobiales bacterium]
MPGLLSPLELIDEPEISPPELVESEELEAVRALVLRAHPDVVPELVTGASVGELLASVDDARAAFSRLADAWSDAQPEPVIVPAGGGIAMPVDPAALPPGEKIRRGLQAVQRRRSQKG